MISLMIAVIIAGGSGTRLWPMSTPDYPKHLLKITGGKSLLRNTFERAQQLTDKIYVVSEVSHAHHVQQQLPELGKDKFIIEPARRGTANCIIATLAELSKKESSSEAIAFLAADHYIRDNKGCVHSFKVATKTSEKNHRIVLVGVEPDYPATGFGYIKKNGIFDEESFVFNVDCFKEKPAYDLAQEYVQSGEYLWNCGYFVASIDTFQQAMKQHAPNLLKSLNDLSTAGKDYQAQYLKLKSDTIDYALIEKVDDLLVVPASFDWMDLGSFNDIHKAVKRDKQNNHLNGSSVGVDGVENAYVVNQEKKPVAVIGVDNIVVVNTPHGVLVARKDQSQKVKEVLADIEKRRTL